MNSNFATNNKNGDPDINEVYIPKKPMKNTKIMKNKDILARHKKPTVVEEPEIKTIQIRQVDVEKMVDKLPAEDESQHDSLSDEDVDRGINEINLPETISVPKIKIKKIKVDVENQETSEEVPVGEVSMGEVSIEEVISKKGLIEKNGDGYYIEDEEDLDKIEGLTNNELYNLLFELSNRIYHEMGCGHTESIYQKALSVELVNHDIYHEKEKRVLITYQDKKHGRVYSLGEERVDLFLLDYNIIIELKSVTNIPREIELAQIRKYYRELLKAGHILDKWGLIINFPQPGQTKKAKPSIDFVLVNL